jgi:hypothetical protein
MTGRYYAKYSPDVWVIISKTPSGYRAEWSHASPNPEIFNLRKYVEGILRRGYIYDETWQVQQLLNEYDREI